MVKKLVFATKRFLVQSYSTASWANVSYSSPGLIEVLGMNLGDRNCVEAQRVCMSSIHQCWFVYILGDTTGEINRISTGLKKTRVDLF